MAFIAKGLTEMQKLEIKDMEKALPPNKKEFKGCKILITSAAGM